MQIRITREEARTAPPGHLQIEPYPFGKTFAIVLTDDTDGARLATLRPIYRTLDEYGIRVTKTVWPLPAVSCSGTLPPAPWDWDTVTLHDRDYQGFCQDLQHRGHEIAMHTASGGDNVRERTIEGYELFQRVLGRYPRTNIMHGRNRENIYWGRHLFGNPVLSRMVRVFEPQDFYGHDPSSPYFWGDICRERTTYVRMLETRSLNTLAFDPATPFHDPSKPYVNWWFSATYGGPRAFRHLLTPESVDDLRTRRGGSIIHTYCPSFTVSDGSGGFVTDPEVDRVLRFLAEQSDGWYVPAAELLDRLRGVRQLRVASGENSLTLTNGGDVELRSLAVSGAGVRGVFNQGRDVATVRNASGQALLGDLPPGATIRLYVEGPPREVQVPPANQPDYLKMFAGTVRRIGWQYLDGQQLVPAATGRMPRLLARRATVTSE